MSGQTLTDRIAAAQYSVTGSAVARAVCKATTHEVMGPKKKHLDYLIQATNETNVNIPQMADTLFERATNSSWVVVFKALVTTHHLMVHGNERFIQYLASRNTLFNLSNFLDKSGSHGYDMSAFIRRYSRYLNEKAFSYRQMAFDFARVKKGIAKTKFFEMKKGQCKDALEIYKRFLTRMTRVSEFLKVAEVSQSNLFKKRDFLFAFKAPSSLMETLEQHLNSLEGKKPGNKSGAPSPLSKSSPATTVTSPNTTPAKSIDTSPPVDLFATASTAAPVSSSKPSSDLLDLQPDFAATGQAAPAAPAGATSWGDAFAASPGEAPAATEGAAAPATPTPVAAALDACSGNDPFAPSEGSAEAAPELDLFAMKPTETAVPVVTPTTSAATPAPATTPSPAAAVAAATTATTATATTTTATTSSVPDVPAAPKPDATPSIDLFGTDAFSSPPHGASPVPESSLTGDLLSVDAFAAPSPLPTASPAKVDSSGVIDLFGGFGGSFIAPSPSPSPVTPAQTSLLQPNFDAAFGTTAPTTGSSFDASVFDGLGDLLMPTMVPAGQSITPAATTTVPASAASKGLGSDLDSSLANLVGTLSLSLSTRGDLQWNAGEKKLTGGANWQPKVAPATWSTGGVPSGPLAGAVPPAGGVPPTGGTPPVAQPGATFGMPPAGPGVPMMPQQPVMYGQPMMRPPFGAAAGPGVQLSPSPTPATQSPKKPPTKDPLADLNIKDFL
uniref:Synaptosome associated protein 91 n=1 Tax=Pavo cristatus TaxID=9049 RepID=A0A8C9FBE1_PAVCR